MSACATHTVTEPPQTKQQPSGRRRDIDGLRAVAVGAVIIGHLWSVVHGGVDISFTISGFVITWLLTKEYLRDGTISFGKFYARRARRLLPGATLVTVATLTATWAWASSLRWRSISLDGLFASLSCLNYRLTAQATDYFADKSASPFQHFWSLSVEEQYYALWPALLVGVAWLGKRWGKSLMAIGITLAIIFATSLTLSIIFTHNNQPVAYFGLHTRAWELAAGALVAVCVRALSRLPQLLATILSWGGLVIIGISIPFITESSMPGYVVGWPVLGCAMTIAGGCANPRFGAERLLGLWPLQFVGQVSYGWYIWHWPILVLLPNVTGRDELSSLDRYGIAFGSLALAIVTYYCVDKPLKSKRFSSLVLQPSKGLSMGIQLIGASVTAAAVMLNCIVPTPVSNPVPVTVNSQSVGEVQQLVADATQIQQLPPELEAALPSTPENWNFSCINAFEVTTPNPCDYGDKSADKLMVAIGDSHTAHWQPALNVIANAHAMKLTTYEKAACPAEPYQNIDNGTHRRYTECEKWRENVYRDVEKLRPAIVILSSAIYDGATTQATAKIVDRLSKTGAKVVVFDDTPRSTFDIPQCLTKWPNTVQRCSFSRTDAEYKFQLRRDRAQTATKHGGIFVALMDWFCTSTVCPAVINGMIVYVDSYHITQTYALALVPELETALRAAFNQ